MDTIAAFQMSMASRGEPLMVFDWVKAASTIKKLNVKNARAGLSGDWEYTGDDILIDGKIPYDSYTYLSSRWAIPELEIDGIKMDCYVMQENRPEWDCHTFWPDGAKTICGL